MKTPQVIGGLSIEPGVIPQTNLSKEMAEKLAEINNKTDEEGWTYTAVPIPNSKRNLHVIEVKDETGKVVGYL